jgi:hypothetical protein
MLTFGKSCQGKTSLGADIGWLSQFAREREMLFPPRTHLQIVGARSQKSTLCSDFTQVHALGHSRFKISSSQAIP